MAAFQSRASTQRRQQYQEEDTENTQGHVISSSRSGAPRRVGSSRAGVALEQESWILFAPKQPAQPVLAHDRDSGAIEAQQDEEQIDPTNPFSTSLASDSTLTDRDGATWHLVAASEASPSGLHATASHPVPTASIQATATIEAQGTIDSSSIQPVSPFAWSSLPRHDSSYFFDDDERVHTAEGDRPLQASIYPSVAGGGSLSSRRDGEETDLLSIPSSLSVSERSTSSDAVSPKIRSAKSFSPQRRRYRNISTLTEAALEEASRAAGTAGQEEAALTSDSEGEASGDADEDLLSKTPDAMSAGIRCARKRQPLRAIKPPSQATLSVRSSQKSGTKRRHRAAGVSNKGSKRSNTSGSIPPQIAREKVHKLPAAAAATTSRQQRSIAKPSFSFGQAARNIFAVDEEVLEMMSQPGSVFSQSLPPAYTASGRKAANDHGLQAFSTHLQSEFGETSGTRYVFSAENEDEEMADIDDMETGYETSHQIRQQYPRYQDDDLHTASLGLHRSFSLAGLQHFLVDSIYGSLPASFLGGNTTAGDLDALQRKRTRSHPGGRTTFERSHSSSELFEQGREDATELGEVQDYSQAVSYWRRVLRSLAM